MSPNAGCLTEEELVAFLQGALADEKRQFIEAHLASCDSCTKLVEAISNDRPHELGSDGSPTDVTQKYAEPGETQPLDPELLPLDVLEPTRALDCLGELSGYDIVRVLGRGGYGVVVEAVDNVLHRKVAIKVLTRDLASRATSRRRFIREARAGAAINHPNVVTIHSVEEAGDTPVIIMELIQGESLHERIRREPKLDVMDILRISAQIAQGLAAAHAQGIIHRDVKPGNVMLVDPVPRVKITDFGLARITADDLELTSHGFTVGTPAYMSPEQVRGMELDARSDLFALGCVIYAMITGHSPFHGRSALDIARRIEELIPPSLSEINKQTPEFLDSIVTRLLQKDPEDRFQSAAEVADLFNRHLAILNQMPSDRLSQALRMPLLETAKNTKHSTRWLAFIALIILVGLGLWTGWPYLWSTETSGNTKSGHTSNKEVQPESKSGTSRETLVGDLNVTVSQSGDADFTTIGEALQRIAPGGRVTIQDAGEYHETIQITDANRCAGVQIVAPRNATVRASTLTAVVTVRSVPRVRLEGLRIVAAQAQLGLEISGACPGLLVTDVTMHRTSNPDGTDTSVAGIVLRHGAAGSVEEPITIRGVALDDTIVGIVIGNPSVEDAPPKHIVIEECTVRGLSRETSTLVALLRKQEGVVIRRNIFAHGSAGLSILVEEQALPVGCEISQNTWHDLENWIGWTGPLQQTMSMRFHLNLVVDSGQVDSDARSVAAAAESPPADNVAVIVSAADRDGFAPLATALTEFPLLSLDPGHPGYLKPDLEKVMAAGFPPSKVPGRHSDSAEPD